MKPASWPRGAPAEERLLVVDPDARRFEDHTIAELPALLDAGDLLVVNDAATLPASLASTGARGAAIELRLAAALPDGSFAAIALGPGDDCTRTEDRPDPPMLTPGACLRISPQLSAMVERVEHPRLCVIRFDREGAELWQALYASGRPIQYAYVAGSLRLWHVQSAFASRPWAFELASAGRPLTWRTLSALVERGVGLARITHAAGISSTGSASLDARLPLTERYAIPARTIEALSARRRVIAVGTTVVRALESSARVHGSPVVGQAQTDLIIGPGFRPRVAHGLLTGMHPGGTSHHAVTAAFAPEALLRAALAHAEQRGYLQHEFGDSCLILPGALRPRV